MLTLRNKKKSYSFNICIDEESLKECDSYKYLGVIIDKNLTWNEQIQHVSQKISKACGYLSKLRHCVTTDTLILVCTML